MATRKTYNFFLDTIVTTTIKEHNLNLEFSIARMSQIADYIQIE